MDAGSLRNIIEGALLAAGRPLQLDQLAKLFAADDDPGCAQIEAALAELDASCRDRGYQLACTASGYRFQVRPELAPWINRLWADKPRKYSRALLETLAVIAYRQPVTRGDVEQIRGVAVSSDTLRTLLEREWIRSVGQREVPGRPALYATTPQFLDYFNLRTLDELPPLSEIRDLALLHVELPTGDDVTVTAAVGDPVATAGD